MRQVVEQGVGQYNMAGSGAWSGTRVGHGVEQRVRQRVGQGVRQANEAGSGARSGEWSGTGSEAVSETGSGAG